MKRYLLVLLLFLPMFFESLESAKGQSNSGFLRMPEGLIALDTQTGLRLLRESQADAAFWRLAQFYSSQPDLGSCSVASCTMVLNALPIDRPISKPHGEFRLFTSDNFFTSNVEAIVSRKKVSASGMTLEELTSVLATYPVEVDCHFASDTTVDSFRKMLRETLQRSDRFVLVNYLRADLNQESGGHISPLGAFNEKEDMVLIIDTANFKYPWTWVKTEQLWRAMANSVDSESNRSRGYVVVSEKPHD
jgi:hypothetical protein